MIDILNNQFAPNTWYHCTIDNFYFKWYMKTAQNGSVDYILVDPKNKEVSKNRQSLARINSMRIKEFIVVDPDQQSAFDLLYES